MRLRGRCSTGLKANDRGGAATQRKDMLLASAPSRLCSKMALFYFNNAFCHTGKQGKYF